MIKYYKWLFQVDEEEEKKEEVSVGIFKGLQCGWPTGVLSVVEY